MIVLSRAGFFLSEKWEWCEKRQMGLKFWDGRRKEVVILYVGTFSH
jgi:hypothetical protein